MVDQKRLNNINTAIQETVNLMQESKIFKSQIRNAEETLSSLQYKLNQLKIKLRKEEKDVERLQSISLANLYHILIKDKEDKLTKEEQEVLAVKAEMDSLHYEISATEVRIQGLKQKITKVGDLDSQYKALFEKKKAYIKAEIPNMWQDIENHTNQKHHLMQKQKEIKEALDAGQMVNQAIINIKHELDSAAGWGVYDMIGGGIMATMIKRNHMDQAQNRIYELRHQLTYFTKELKDINASFDIDLQLSDFLGFADWFFDGFFVDMMIQNKINDAVNQIESINNKVQAIILKLQNEEKSLLKQINDKTELIKAIVVGV